MKRVVVFGDIHCGAQTGLTPPDWQYKITKKDTSRHNKYATQQAIAWRTFLSLLRSIAPFDVVLCMGDMIDGTGSKAGGVEQLTTDRNKQVTMACEVFDAVRSISRRGDKLEIVGCYGTGYHVSSSGEDFEDQIADKTGFVKIGSHEWPEVEGYVFDIKHKVNFSSIPHGIYTSIARDALWNALWHELDLQPKANCILRGHTHAFAFCGDDNRMCFLVPALQDFGTRYGTRECSRIVKWGLLHFDVSNGKCVDWQSHTASLPHHKVQTLKLGRG